MKTHKIITKISLVLIVFITSCLHSCQKGDWCVDCQWVCDVQPIGPDSRTLCADSPEACEAEVQDFMDRRSLPKCWECGDPYEN